MGVQGVGSHGAMPLMQAEQESPKALKKSGGNPVSPTNSGPSDTPKQSLSETFRGTSVNASLQRAQAAMAPPPEPHSRSQRRDRQSVGESPAQRIRRQENDRQNDVSHSVQLRPSRASKLVLGGTVLAAGGIAAFQAMRAARQEPAIDQCFDTLMQPNAHSPQDKAELNIARTQLESKIDEGQSSLLPIGGDYRREEDRGVRYLSTQEREACHVSMKNGKILTAEGGRFDTGKELYEAIFVLDAKMNLYISKASIDGKIHHSSLVAGEPVIMAGTIKVKNGKPYYISDSSGHYRPKSNDVDNFKSVLIQKGFDINNIRFKTRNK